MEEQIDACKWQRGAIEAHRNVLEQRLEHISRQWLEAMTEFRRLYHSELPDIAQLRRLNRRVYELEQQRLAFGLALNG